MSNRRAALIIVNEKFDNPADDRHGAEHDRRKMEALFKALDFNVQTDTGLTADNMKAVITDGCRDENNRHAEYFALIISSHGEEIETKSKNNSNAPSKWKQYIVGVDGSKVALDEILEIIEKSEVLQNVPKLLFIQACRARFSRLEQAHDKGQDIEVLLERYVCQTSEAWFETDWGLCDLVQRLEGNVESLPAELTNVSQQPMEVDNAKRSLTDYELKGPTTKRIKLAASETITGTSSGKRVVGPEYYGKSTANVEEKDIYSRTRAGQKRSKEASGDTTQTDAQGVPQREDTGYPRLSTPVQETSFTESGQQNRQPVGAEASRPMTRSSGTAAQGQTSSVQEEIHSGPPNAVSVPNLPNDVLIVFPSMGGRYAYRDNRVGSLLFHSMYKGEHIRMLLEGQNLMQYLTRVAGDIAGLDIEYKDQSYKANICVQHRLCRKVCFKEIDENSLMAKIKQSVFS